MDFYVAIGSEKRGPFSEEEARQLVKTGEAKPTDLAFKEGIDDWVPLKELITDLPSQSVPPIPAANHQPLFCRLLDALLSKVRPILNENRFEGSERFLIKAGMLCPPIAAVAGLVIGIFLAIKTDSFLFFAAGCGWVLTVIFLQYIAYKFLSVASTLVERSPTCISSKAPLDALSILFLFTGLGTFIMSVVTAIKAESIDIVFYGVGAMVTFTYLAWVALHPKLIYISIKSECSVGEEAIGVLSIFLKGLIRLIPIAFGAWIILGTLELLASSLLFFGKEDPDSFLPKEMEAALSSLKAGYMIVTATLLPMMGYVLFLSYYLFIEVIRSILILPSKIEESQ
jgi:hypothetical protein